MKEETTKQALFFLSGKYDNDGHFLVYGETPLSLFRVQILTGLPDKSPAHLTRFHRFRLR